ncbi:MAG: electron transport complex subunit RsxC [Gammaproteobacteria bacterium]
MSRKLWHFHGGLSLAGHKDESMRKGVLPTRLPSHLILPLQQHIGEPAEPVVAVGDHVLKGEVIARAHGYVSAPVHATSSGTVVAIEERPVAHPSGLSAPCIVIETDGREKWRHRDTRITDYTALDPSELRNRIREAGVVGLGGAGFPAFIKLNPGTARVKTLILNGAECEPYITCDAVLMQERPREIVEGLLIMRHALRAETCLIGIEDNKPRAIEALRNTLAEYDAEGVEVVAVPTRYPAGGEKQLIKVLTGEEVPSHGLPLHVGIVCHNVGTAAAVYRAIAVGEPLVSRIVTVTGRGISHPRNLEVLIGTPIADLLAECGETRGDLDRLIMGGPMMGFALHTDETPVVKTTNCILAATHEDVVPDQPALPCIRCGECTRVCPVSLLPQQLYWHARAKDFDKVQDYNLFDCIECGCCAYVCPSHLPLVQYYRFAKTEIWAKEREKERADIARRRHEFRLARLEREKAEREARHRQKREALAKDKNKGKGADQAADESKKAAIKEAMERAKAKRAAAGVTPKNTENLSDEQRRQIAEADARRKATKAPAEASAEDSAGEANNKESE